MRSAARRSPEQIGWLVLSWGLLLVVAYRGLVLGQQSPDLLLLVVVAGAVGGGYQASRGSLTRRDLAVVVVAVTASLVAGIVIALVARSA